MNLGELLRMVFRAPEVFQPGRASPRVRVTCPLSKAGQRYVELIAVTAGARPFKMPTVHGQTVCLASYDERLLSAARRLGVEAHTL